MKSNLPATRESFTKVDELNIDLDGLDTIITHPGNVDIIKRAIEKQSKKIDSFIAFSHAINIKTNPNLEQFKQKEKDGKKLWQRGSILPDTQFVEWIDDIENPTSWQIYFGLVEPILEPLIYLTKKSLFTVRKEYFPVVNSRYIITSSV
jgi:hypothetical protein